MTSEKLQELWRLAVEGVDDELILRLTDGTTLSGGHPIGNLWCGYLPGDQEAPTTTPFAAEAVEAAWVSWGRPGPNGETTYCG